MLADADERLVALTKALASPARVAILRTLAERQHCICGEIVDVLPIAQATVSQHLKVLREAGLVQGTIDGPRSCYCLDPEGLARAAAHFGAFLHSLTAPRGCCA